MSRQDPPRSRVVTLKPKGPAGVPPQDVAESPPPLPTGTQLVGRYRLDTILGRGGMATVYMGLDQALGREVAIKVLEPEMAAQAIVVKRFVREAQIMASLDSPRVVSIYDVGRDGPHVFLVMKCLAGVPLQDLIVQDGALPPERAVPLVAQVLEGLAVVHRHGLVHRDVKPGNVMVLDGDQAVLLDLGIARDPGSRGMTTEGTVLGTPEYMAPEQMLGRTVDHRTDLYAVGVMLFEALTGRLPFHGETPIEIGLRHVNDDPPSPRRFASWISEALAAVVLRAMAKDPAQRYQSANEMREALLAALAVAAPGLPGAEHLPAVPPAGDARGPHPSLSAAAVGCAADVGVEAAMPPFGITARGSPAVQALPDPAPEAAQAAAPPAATAAHTVWPKIKRRRALRATLAAGTVFAAVAALVVYLAARSGNELPAGPPRPMPVGASPRPPASPASPGARSSAPPALPARPTAGTGGPPAAAFAGDAASASDAGSLPPTPVPDSTATALQSPAIRGTDAGQGPQPTPPRPPGARTMPGPDHPPHRLADTGTDAAASPGGPAEEARVRLEQGDVAGALRILETAIERTPDRAALYRVLGDTYLHAGNRIGAIAAYRRFLALEPEGRDAERVRARLRRLGVL